MLSAHCARRHSCLLSRPKQQPDLLLLGCMYTGRPVHNGFVLKVDIAAQAYFRYASTADRTATAPFCRKFIGVWVLYRVSAALLGSLRPLLRKTSQVKVC